MASYPARNKFALLMRVPFVFVERHLPLPYISPNLLTAVGIILTFVYIPFYEEFPLNALLIFIILFSDALDGMIARKYDIQSSEGYIIDAAFDRLSELLIFAPLLNTNAGRIFMLVAIINICLTYYALMYKKHFLIPIRIIFLLYLIATWVL